jgi:hypothetical protein
VNARFRRRRREEEEEKERSGRKYAWRERGIEK